MRDSQREGAAAPDPGASMGSRAWPIPWSCCTPLPFTRRGRAADGPPVLLSVPSTHQAGRRAPLCGSRRVAQRRLHWRLLCVCLRGSRSAHSRLLEDRRADGGPLGETGLCPRKCLQSCFILTEIYNPVRFVPLARRPVAHVQGPPVPLTPGVTVGGLSSRNGPIAGSAVVGREEEGGEPAEWEVEVQCVQSSKVVLWEEEP